MIQVSGSRTEMRAVLPASLAAVEEFFLAFRRYATGRLPHPHCFLAELLAREALNNAVIHGCKANPGKRVRCRLRLTPRYWTVTVEDEGEGFDWKSRGKALPGSLATSGRGIAILRKYAVKVRFNKQGNAVTVTGKRN